MIRRLSSLEQLRAFRPAWEALYARSGLSNLFLTPEWLLNWYQHWSPKHLAVFVRHDRADQLPDALLPLYRKDEGWSLPDAHSYRAGMLSKRATPLAWREMTRAAFALPGCGCIRLWRCPDEPPFLTPLEEGMGMRRMFLLPREGHVSHVIDTAQASSVYLASRRSKVRQELRRKDKALASARCNPGLTVFDQPGQVDDGLAILETIERASWKADSGTAIVSDESELAFYRDVFRIRTARSRGRLFVLAGASGPLAHLLGVQHDGVFYALKTSYRQEDAALSPGQVLFLRVVQRLCDEEPGVTSVELLGKDSRWKRELATSTRDERTFEMLRPSRRALAQVGWTALQPAMDRLCVRHPKVADSKTFFKRLVRALD